MLPEGIYRWFRKVWTGLDFEQFPHGVIVSGIPGIGRHDFVKQLIQSLLCSQNGPQGQACNHCRSCELYLTGANADYKSLLLVEGKTQIGVDQVRDSISWINTSHQFNAKKVLFIPQAELMTVQAANSLLKTLEEPPAETVIILLVEHIESLIPTIRSRCRSIHLPGPDRQEAKEWLANQTFENLKNISTVDNLELLLDICSNAPLKVKELISGEEYQQRQLILDQILSVFDQAEDPVMVAKNLEKIDNSIVIYWFYALVMDLIRCRFQLESRYIMNKDYLNHFQAMHESINLIMLYEVYAELNKYYQQRSSQLNQQLLLESLLIRWRNCSTVL